MGQPVLAAEVGVAIFAVADASPGAEVPCRLGGEVVELRGAGPARYATAENWLTTMWLAVLARDANGVERHTAVPVELLTASGAAEPRYLLHMVRMLPLFFRLESGADRELNSAVAHDAGGVIAVRSDYLPAALYDGSAFAEHG